MFWGFPNDPKNSFQLGALFVKIQTWCKLTLKITPTDMEIAAPGIVVT